MNKLESLLKNLAVKYEWLIVEKNKFQFTCIANDEIAGRAELCLYSEGWCFRNCYVFPTYRGLGIQDKFIKLRLALLQDLGAKTVNAYVGISNTYSMYNLHKNKFECTYEIRIFNGEKYFRFVRKL